MTAKRGDDKLIGYLDKDTERVTIEANIGADGIGRLTEWLRSVSRWVRKQDIKRAGGKRWEFDRPFNGRAAARYMTGEDCWGTVELVQRGTLKPWKCTSCGRGNPAKERCWRQAPRTHSGYARERFCADCVERGGPPGPPKLSVIDGGCVDVGDDVEPPPTVTGFLIR